MKKNDTQKKKVIIIKNKQTTNKTNTHTHTTKTKEYTKPNNNFFKKKCLNKRKNYWKTKNNNKYIF